MQTINTGLQCEQVLLEHKVVQLIRRQDLTQPILTMRQTLQLGERQRNRGILDVRHSLGQRTNIRIGCEGLTRIGVSTGYKRLRHCAVFLSCPTPEQAELAIEAILSFAQSLDGIWLTASPEPGQVAPVEPAKAQGVDSTASGDQPAISSESADDLQEP